MSRVLESDDSGSLTIPPEVLGNDRPHLVEPDSGGIHIEPENSKGPPGIGALHRSEPPNGRL